MGITARAIVVGDGNSRDNIQYIAAGILVMFVAAFSATYLTSITTVLPVSPIGILLGMIAGVVFGYLRAGLLQTWIAIAAAVYAREFHYVGRDGFLESLPSSHLADPGYLLISASAVTILTIVSFTIGFGSNLALAKMTQK